MRRDRYVLLMIAVSFVAACAKPVEQRVAVMHGGNALLLPATAAAADCLEHCDVRKTLCFGSCAEEESCELECYGAHEHCVEDCPGAHWSAVQQPREP